MTVLAWPAIVAKAGAARRAAWLWFRFAARFGLLIPVSIGVGLVFGNDAALNTMVVLVVLGIALMPFPQAADEAAEERPVFDGFPTILFFWLLHRARHRVRVMDPYLHLLARPAQLNQAATRYQVLLEAVRARLRQIVFLWLLQRAARRGVEVEVLLTHPNSDYYLPATARRILYTTGVRYRRSILDGLAVLGALRDRLPVAAGDRLAVRIVDRLPQHSYYLADDQVLMSYAQPEDRPTFRARWHFHHSEDPIAQMAAFEFEAGWELADGFGFVEQFGTELPAALDDILPVTNGVPRRFTVAEDPFCSKGFDGCGCAWAPYPDGQGGYIAREFRDLYQGPVVSDADTGTATVRAYGAGNEDADFGGASVDPMIPDAARWRPQVEGAVE